MITVPDVARARFGGWEANIQLPAGVRPPGVRAAEYVYDYLKNNIVTLEIPPRSIITESEIAEATGVSRTPVREAFMRLQTGQLLEMIPSRGALVPPITLRSIQEQAETRVVLEGYGVEWICNHRMPVARRLQELVDEQRTIYDDDPERVVEMISVDKEFHWTLVKAIGNTEFAQLYNALHDRQVRVGVAMFKAFERRRCSAIEQHQEIVDAIAAFDLPLAQQKMQEHLVGGLAEVSGYFTN